MTELNTIDKEMSLSEQQQQQQSKPNDDASSASATNLSMTSKRTVRLVYCSDGVVEECDEDIEEQQRLEREAHERELEERRKMDLEAKNLTWVPWFGYMAKRTAVRTLEACDYAGEKLAWWFGITKPKFLYEINEYEEMMREQERRANEEDPTEKIVVGEMGKITIQSVNQTYDPESLTAHTNRDEETTNNDHYFSQPVDLVDAQIRLYEQNEQSDGGVKKKPLLQS